MAKLETFDPVNIASGKGSRIRDVLNTLLEVDGFQEAHVVMNPTKPSMIPIRLVDVTKSKALLNFTPQTSLNAGLQKTIAWYRETHGPKILSKSNECSLATASSA